MSLFLFCFAVSRASFDSGIFNYILIRVSSVFTSQWFSETT